MKTMLEHGTYNDQDILAYFTRPTRSINHRVISEIRNKTKYKAVEPASKEKLDDFLDNWPNVDSDTGLSLRGDELLIKAREAMIAAVHTFNGAGLTFRTALFIVTAIIAWTYLLHAWFKQEGIDFRYKKTTKQGAIKYWDIGKCLRHMRCPVSQGVKLNLEFILELRHKIEHRYTGRIDDEVVAELQACCINFNDALKDLFGSQYGLEKRLSIALQFVSFGADQRALLKKATSLPQHVATFVDAFRNALTDEQLSDPAFRMRIAFVKIVRNRASGADRTVEFIKADSDESLPNEIFLKEVNRERYIATKVIKRVKAKGFPRFSNKHHIALWKRLDAKNPDKGYGCQGEYKNMWVWFDRWIARVLEHCKENANRYT